MEYVNKKPRRRTLDPLERIRRLPAPTAQERAMKRKTIQQILRWRREWAAYNRKADRKWKRIMARIRAL